MTTECPNPLATILMMGQAKRIVKSIQSTDQGRVSEILRQDSEVEVKVARLVEVIKSNQEFRVIRDKDKESGTPQAFMDPIILLILLLLTIVAIKA
jgi:hypothetical protein